ncbi:MAG: hydrolase [Deltaproteobacteria bacterium]|nr:hydrolase [Deltaproteobacteria bacterium]
MQTSFITSSDGTKLRIGKSGDGSKNILLVPGLAEHLGRYEHVVEALNTAGWSVTVVELRGHGKSEGKQGHVDQWNQYLEDVQAAAATIDGPVVVLGHSMGGLVALDLAINGLPNGISALALSDPNVAVAIEAPTVKVMGARLLSKLFPGLSLDNELDSKLISRDPAVVEKYNADPLVYSTITPRWYTEMVKSQERVVDHSTAYTLPLLMLLGEGDAICDWKASEALARNWGGTAKTIRYPELYHEIFNEPEKEQVISDLVQWLGELG